jgi:hypothetical protein
VRRSVYCTASFSVCSRRRTELPIIYADFRLDYKLATLPAGEQAQCRPLTRIRLAGRPAKKRTLDRSSRLREERSGSRELLGLDGNAIRVAQPSLSPLPCGCQLSTVRSTPSSFAGSQLSGNPLYWLNVRHQMIADQHDRAPKVIFSRIKENEEILGNLKIESTTAR